LSAASWTLASPFRIDCTIRGTTFDAWISPYAGLLGTVAPASIICRANGSISGSPASAIFRRSVLVPGK
jgi:hypothetical protein